MVKTIVKTCAISILVGISLFSCKNSTDNKKISPDNQLNEQDSAITPWYFSESGPYFPINDSYKGPNWLLKGKTDSGLNDAEAEFSEISANGRYIVFSSRAKLTSDAPTNGMKLYRCTLNQESSGSSVCGTIELVSRRPASVVKTECGDLSLPAIVANGDFILPSISADGNKIAFVGQSLDLVPEVLCDVTTNTPKINDKRIPTYEVYIIDIVASKVSQISGGLMTSADNSTISTSLMSYHKPSISLDGKTVAFVSKHPMFESGIMPPASEESNAFEHIFLYSDVTKEIGWVTMPTTPALPKGRGGDSMSPQLNETGDTVVFKSLAKLVPEDQTDMCDAKTKVANVYMAKFNTGPMGVEVNKRSSLELVSVDKGTNKSTGCAGSLYPSITADGRYVMFISLKHPTKIVDSGLNDAIGLPPSDSAYIQVYLRDMTTKQTVLVSLDQFENISGTKNFNPIKDHVVYPTISPNGKYALFTSMGKNIYMNNKMKKFLNKDVVTGTNNDCASLVIHATEHASYMWTNDPLNIRDNFIRSKTKGGWRDVQSSDCLPALHPNNWSRPQVYRIELDGLQVKDLKPMSITPPLAISTFYEDFDPTRTMSIGGRDAHVSIFGQVYQIHYADADAVSGTDDGASRTITNTGTAIFYSSARNLINVKENITPDIAPSYYQALPNIDVNYIFSEKPGKYEKYFEDDPYYPFYPLYKVGQFQKISTFVFPDSQIVKLER